MIPGDPRLAPTCHLCRRRCVFDGSRWICPHLDCEANYQQKRLPTC